MRTKLLALVLASSAVQPALAGIDTFNYGNMAWSYSTVTGTSSTLGMHTYAAAAPWLSNGGNLGGTIYGSAPAVGAALGTERMYALHSDVWEPLWVGATLAADVRVSGAPVRAPSGSTSTARLRWFIASHGDVYVSKNGMNPNDAVGWMTYGVTLLDAQFDLWSGARSFSSVVDGADQFGVAFVDGSLDTSNLTNPSWSNYGNYGFVSTGPGDGRVLLDNIAVPDSGAAAATASLGLLCMVRRRRT